MWKNWDTEIFQLDKIIIFLEKNNLTLVHRVHNPYYVSLAAIVRKSNRREDKQNWRKPDKIGLQFNFLIGLQRPEWEFSPQRLNRKYIKEKVSEPYNQGNYNLNYEWFPIAKQLVKGHKSSWQRPIKPKAIAYFPSRFTTPKAIF